MPSVTVEPEVFEDLIKFQGILQIKYARKVSLNDVVMYLFAALGSPDPGLTEAISGFYRKKLAAKLKMPEGVFKETITGQRLTEQEIAEENSSPSEAARKA